MSDDGKRLTPLETIIMGDLWEHTPSTVRSVRARLEERKPMAYTTVLTVMRKLRDKGFLLSERDGRADQYRPTVSREQMASRGLRDMLSAFFAGSSAALVSSLLSSEEVAPEELARIRMLVDARLTDEQGADR